MERNSVALEYTRLRLVSEKMIDMFWIAGIEGIREVSEMPFLIPNRVYPYHTILEQVRLHVNPAPFVDVRGYRVRDIVRLLSNDADIDVRLVSKDGIEQILSFKDYFYNAILAIEGESYNILSPDMPTGMWLKDVMIIDFNQIVIFFHKNIDKENNFKYQDFMKLLSGRDWTVRSKYERAILTDLEELTWENVVFIY